MRDWVGDTRFCERVRVFREPFVPTESLLMGGVRVLFSSDLHGNDDHLKRLLARAEQEGCDVIILGGDLGPRGTGYGRDAGVDTAGGPSFVASVLDHLPKLPTGKIDWDTDEALAYMKEGYEQQREWFTKVLVPMLEQCKVPSVCLFGNSDWSGLLPEARAARKHLDDGTNAHVRFVEGEGDFWTVHTRAVDVSTGKPTSTCDILSLSLVPVCGHRKKDWERCDTINIYETTSRTGDIAASGFVSAPDGSSAVRGAVEVSEQGAQVNSIETRLETIIHNLELKKISVPRLWITHAPPMNSIGDKCLSGDHVGSLAVREAIEKHVPSMTLHGHIHESVRLHDGVFKQEIKNTLVCSVGNDFKETNPHALLFSTNDLLGRDVQRIEVKE